MKKCPIMMASGRIGHCIEEECAWWINATDGCAIRELATHNQLVDIVFSQETNKPSKESEGWVPVSMPERIG